MSIIEVAIEVHDALGDAGVAHAFGGALALAYVAEPRGTVDIDVNVFLPTASLDVALDAIAPLGFEPERERGEWVPAAGIRVRRAADLIPIDVFPSLDEERYASIAARALTYPFGPAGRELPFLSCEDLVVFKLSFGRDKDWVDLRRIAEAHPDLDDAYVEDQLVALRGATMYPRLARLRSMLRRT